MNQLFQSRRAPVLATDRLSPRGASPRRLPSAYALVALTALALAACQPHEGPAERAGKAVDHAAESVSDKAADVGKSIKSSAEEASAAIKDKAQEAKQ